MKRKLECYLKQFKKLADYNARKVMKDQKRFVASNSKISLLKNEEKKPWFVLEPR